MGERRLYHRITRELGGMTVDEMLSRISSSEITYWSFIFEEEDEELEKANKK